MSLADLLNRATPGPWRWLGQRKSGMFLGTPYGGRRLVMDFVRQGMRGAQPRFQVYEERDGEPWEWNGLMTNASDLAVLEVTYREDIVDIDHADARLIALAPDMARLLIAERDIVEWALTVGCLEPNEEGVPACQGTCVTCRARMLAPHFAALDAKAGGTE